MKYVFSILMFIMLSSVLWGQLNYWPLTTIAEDVTSVGCLPCEVAFQGLTALQTETGDHPGLFFPVRYYMQSGASYAVPNVENRVNAYGVFSWPTVIFNGNEHVSGGGEGIGNGQIYTNVYRNYEYTVSPIRMEVVSFDQASYTATFKVTMYDPAYELSNAIQFMLVEDNVDGIHTNVVRDLIGDVITLWGQGNQVQFTKTFSNTLVQNMANTWVAAFVQTGDETILQAVSSKPCPSLDFRFAVPFKREMHAPIGGPYQSPIFTILNLGQSDNYTINLVSDSVPNGWNIGYCSTLGSCFPPDMAIPFSLAEQENAQFYLDVIPASSGVASFHYEINFPHAGTTVSIPFTFTTDDLPNEDMTAGVMTNGAIASYPNPFHGRTTIHYQMTKTTAMTASLDIYNVKGQFIRSFRNLTTENNAGNVQWDGTDSQGKSVPSGMYFTRINGAPAAKTHKIMYIK